MKLMNLLEQRNRSEIDKLFDKTATAQRGEPERAMMQIQLLAGGGVFPWVVEHVGDLTHRMSESFDFFKGGRENVQDKVEKTLRTLTHRYGFEREMKENFESNYEYRVERGDIDPEKVSHAQYVEQIKDLSKAYAAAHRKIPVFNNVQRTARTAAIALGEWNFKLARVALWNLKGLLDDGNRYEEEMAIVDQQTTEGMDAGTFLSKDLPQGVTGYPLPQDSKDYVNINSERRGGAKVKVRHGNKTSANKKAKHTA